MGLKLANNALSRLSASISPTDTTVTLVPGGGAAFPTLATGDYFPATIVKADGSLEIVKVTARSTDVLTVVRAQESTTAKAFNAGDRIELRLTAGTYASQFSDVDSRLSTQNNLHPSGTALTPIAQWVSVPQMVTDNSDLTDEINAQAQALANRTAASVRWADTIVGFDATGATDGAIVCFHGRNTKGDGLGGPLRYSASSTATPNGGTVFAPAVGSGRLLRDDVKIVTPQMFGGVADGATDCYVAIQAAVDYLSSIGGGTVFFRRGTYLCNTPILLPKGVRITGEGRDCTVIRKDSTTTKTVTIYAGALVVYGGASLPSDMNAVVILTGPGGRYTGGITNVSVDSTLATAGNYESQKAEFGVVSVGSVSDCDLSGTYINAAQYGLILPTVFASRIVNNRISDCLQASGIDDGTSTEYTGNYANNCRSGHFIRGLKYSTIAGNACDYVNDPAKYPTRTRTSFAYRLRSLVGCTFEGNGDEQTWGRNLWLETLDNCSVVNHTSIGIGSDYIGVDQIAWIYSDGVLRSCTVKDCVGYGVKSGGLLYGGAVAGQHHNYYFETVSFVINSTFSGNMVRESVFGVPVEAGWGNNNPSKWTNGAVGGDLVQTFSPTLTANVVGDLNITYGVGNKHYRHDAGNLYHVFGCFDVGIGYTTAGSYLIFQGFPANQNIPWRISVTGVDNDGALTKKLGSFALNAGQGSGISFAEDGTPFLITDIPNNTSLKIYYDGWYAKA